MYIYSLRQASENRFGESCPRYPVYTLAPAVSFYGNLVLDLYRSIVRPRMGVLCAGVL